MALLLSVGRASTSALTTNSNLPASSTNDIRGIKAPLEIPSPWSWLWWLAAALAIAALCWWLWRRRKRKPAEAPPAEVIPPHQRAMERLREALALMDQPQPFCIAVSDAIRAYLEARFELRAPERTTEEFLDELRSSALLTRDQKQTLGEFLTQCDLVKFARYEPQREELQRLHDAAVRLVEETQPPPPAQVPPEATSPNVKST